MENSQNGIYVKFLVSRPIPNSFHRPSSRNMYCGLITNTTAIPVKYNKPAITRRLIGLSIVIVYL